MTQQAATQQDQQAQQAPRRDREWFWRALAGLMLLSIGWVGWVAYQVTPSSLVTPAAYSALAQAQAQAARNIHEGTIRQPKKAPPVDVEKLRLAESIETPILQK